jgi:hypothetical protein
MDRYDRDESWTGVPGAIAPADGNLATVVARASVAEAFPPGDSVGGRQQDAGATNASLDLGPNNGRLDDVKPELVNALRELVRQYRQEGCRCTAARDSEDSPGAALLARLAICLVISQRHALASAV